MIKEYKNGDEFLMENLSSLELNPYMTSLIIVDAKALKEISKLNYALKIEEDEEKLLAIRIEPFHLLFYGEEKLLSKLLEYIDKKEYRYDGIFTSTIIGDELLRLNMGYHKDIGMDFMIADSIFEPSSNKVITPSLSDLDEIYKNMIEFVKDCGLQDKIYKEKIQEKLDHYRVIKVGNEIVSMASYSIESKDSIRITHVYTKKEYRGLKYARMVVNTLKNEIISMGYKATLNVDQKNPISYHLYTSLGFKRMFSQAIYLK